MISALIICQGLALKNVESMFQTYYSLRGNTKLLLLKFIDN
jgi:hypothetical protein